MTFHHWKGCLKIHHYRHLAKTNEGEQITKTASIGNTLPKVVVMHERSGLKKAYKMTTAFF